MIQEKTIAKKKGLRTTKIPPYVIIKEALRGYTKFKRHAALTGQDYIEHTYTVYDDDGIPTEKISIELSLWDLFRGVKKISPRKREALWYGVILDKRQEEVGEIMGCRPVTCGQYANSACMQLAEEHLSEQIEVIDGLA